MGKTAKGLLLGRGPKTPGGVVVPSSHLPALDPAQMDAMRRGQGWIQVELAVPVALDGWIDDQLAPRDDGHPLDDLGVGSCLAASQPTSASVLAERRHLLGPCVVVWDVAGRIVLAAAAHGADVPGPVGRVDVGRSERRAARSTGRTDGAAHSDRDAGCLVVAEHADLEVGGHGCAAEADRADE
jgi:hypothetical protein